MKHFISFSSPKIEKSFISGLRKSVGRTVNPAQIDINFIHSKGFRSKSYGIKLFSQKDTFPQVVFECTDFLPQNKKEKLLLTPEQEKLTFLKFNYSKYRLYQLRKINSKNVKSAISWATKVVYYNDILILANIGLIASHVLYITAEEAKDNFAKNITVLMKTINLFNVNYGYKFSTYAVNSLKRQMWRENKDRDKKKKLKIEPQCASDIFISNYPKTDNALEIVDRNDLSSKIKEIINCNSAKLSDKELFIIKEKFYKGQNFRQIAVKFDQTHQRVHQMYKDSLVKIKKYLARKDIDQTSLV